MRVKIGVIGSGLIQNRETKLKAYGIGKEIATSGCILVTGAGGGLPYEAVRGAKEDNGIVIGISPASNNREHVEKYGFPVALFDVLVFTGFGLKGRNVLFVRTCDCVVMLAGRIGTLNEFTIAFDESKPIGVLKGSGGISERIEDIVECSGKKGGPIVYESDPHLLIQKIIKITRRMKSK